MDTRLIAEIVGFASAAVGLITAMIGRRKEVVHHHEYGGDKSKRSFTSIGRIGILITVAGLTVGLTMFGLARFTGLSPVPEDLRVRLETPSRPEVQFKHLRAEVNNIEKDINKNLGRLAHMQVDVEFFSKELDAKRDRQAKLRADIGDMQKSLDAQTEQVTYRGKKVDSSRLTVQLDMAVVEFNILKEKIKAQVEVLADKKRALEAARNRITVMKTQQEKLRLLATKLGTDLGPVKMKEMENQVIEFDQTTVSEADQTVKDIELQLREAEARMKLRAQFGDAEKIPVETNRKSTEEVLKSAREALRNDK